MARELVRRSLPSGRTARVIMSEAADGDLAVGGPEDLTAIVGEVVDDPAAGERLLWDGIR